MSCRIKVNYHFSLLNKVRSNVPNILKSCVLTLRELGEEYMETLYNLYNFSVYLKLSLNKMLIVKSHFKN